MQSLLATGAFIALGGAFVMAQRNAMGRLDKTWQAHSVELPVPFSLSDAELRAEKTAALGADAGVEDALAGVDLAAVAKERALAQGKYLLESRYGCLDCPA
jgi:hypothetical protein